MRHFAFVSDFDGTLTERDFYHIIIQKYLGEEGKNFYINWKKTNKINVEFLNKIFGALDRNEEEIRQEIIQIPIDKNAKRFVEKIVGNGGKFYIVSAGTSYYIHILLEYLGIKNVEVISMKGNYKNRGIEIVPDQESTYFSETFGLDKRKIVEDLKKQYDVVFFAGDSEPDLYAALAADVAFAKGELKELLDKEQKPYIAVNNFEEIEAYMRERGWLTNENVGK